MNIPKILITNNFCSSNRGDAAILEGFIFSLRQAIGECHLVVSSFFPEVARHFHRCETVPPLFPTVSPGKGHALRYAVQMVQVLTWAFLHRKGWKFWRLLPQASREAAKAYVKADLIVSVGGSYLIENYQPGLWGRLFEYLIAKILGKPVVLSAHSIGPFPSFLPRRVVGWVLNQVDLITTRDNESLSVLRYLGVHRPIIRRVADTAFALGGRDGTISASSLLEREALPSKDRPWISVSVRRWFFYGHGVCSNHEAYVRQMARLCDRLVEALGAEILFFSTCTSFGGYGNDDRAVAWEVQELMQHSDRTHILMGEYTVREMIQIWGAMDLHIGTRMHSNIFAMLAGTPCVGIAYEFKTQDLFDEVGLGNYVCRIEDFSADRVFPKVQEAWHLRPSLQAKVQQFRRVTQKAIQENIRYISEILMAYS